MIIKRLLLSGLLIFSALNLMAAGFEIADLEWAKDVGARETPDIKKVYNVSAYGAKGDGVAMETKAIQAAVDACYENGGGKVTFNPGSYLTGSIYVKDGVYLEIPEGTTIYGSMDIEDYPVIDTRVAGIEMQWPSALINVLDSKNVMIGGKGTVFAQGKIFWDKYWTMRKDYEARGLRWIVDYDCDRPRTLLVSESEDVTVKDLTFQQAGFWTVQLLYSSHCTVDGVTIQNNIDGHGPSTDGIDIDSSTKILIENCDIDCNDDNYCLKAGRDADGLRVNRPTEYVVIRNCISRSGAGLMTCGSETSGGIRYILVHDMVAKGTSSGFMFKSALTRGGGIENIYLKNIEMDSVRTALNATVNWNPAYSYSTLPAEYEGKEVPAHWVKLLTQVEPKEKGIPFLRNVYISDVVIKNAGTAFNVAGYEKSTIDNFNFDNVRIEARNGGKISFARNWTAEDSELITNGSVTITDSENIVY
ncbi:MAG: glycoside hydrolase family 28 protein [Rikenellaceae bacterium]|nr:glycoside hydrolase family 28 protein [Rikenellaceae bacterium]